MNEAFEKWRQDQDKYNMPTHEETFRAGMLAAAEKVEAKGGYHAEHFAALIREAAKS